MATCNVNVLCPNGRRQKVKVSPQMTLIQLIQEVCKKQNLNPKNYSIRHQRKILDSSLTVRFANLPNNAHLELIESAEEQVYTVKKCLVALQLESGDRLVHEFNSDDTLFKILQHWKSESERLTFDDSAAGVACIYANQEIKGLEKLKSTTLSMVGLNGGRGVVRLIQPSSTKSEKDESVMMQGVIEKPDLVQATDAETMAAPSSVAVKSSTEDMEMVSRTASSVSMTSQESADSGGMQCTDSILVSQHASLPEKSTVAISEADGKPSNKSRKNKKDEKSHEEASAMDVEPPAPKVDVAKEVPEDAENAFPAGTCKSAVTVQVFSGVGRTLCGSEPDVKKARFHSPPSSEDNFNSSSQEDTKAEIGDNGNVGQLDRQTVAFRVGEGVSISSDDISDDFFEVTVNDLRLMLKDLKSERAVEEPMMTKSMKEMQEKSKIDKYERVAIRVYFPDRSVLQGFFSPREKVSDVTHFVQEHLQHISTAFYLYTTPPKTLMNEPNMTLFEAKLVPAAVIHFGTRETQECYLNSNIQQQMKNITEANEKVGKQYSACLPTASSNVTTVSELEKKDTDKIDDDIPQAVGNTTNSEPKQAPVDGGVDNAPRKVDKAVPKWFKLGK